MDTRMIGYFIACYEMGSLNKAAGALYMSPQGLGKVLDRLEEELGAPVFYRTKQGLMPTESGRFSTAGAQGCSTSSRTSRWRCRGSAEEKISFA